MARTADEFDLSELLAQLARSGMEACCARGIVFLYDHEGLHANVCCAQERLSALIFAIMARAHDMRPVGGARSTAEHCKPDER